MIPMLRLATALLAAAAVAVPAGAFAQDAAPPPATDQLPSYGQPAPSYGSNEDVVRGQIVSFDGGYNLRVRDERGFIDSIMLHQGTIINPTGLRLAAGMSVTVRGVNRGTYLDANQIDTPYATYGAVPVYPYGVAVAPLYYGYPYGYGYPNFSIGIGFGGYYGGGGYYRRWR